jgi:hypothetical protein
METYIVDGIELQRMESGTVRAISTVTECKGSWKYQDAFRDSYYRVRYSPRQKRHFWQSYGQSGKYAQGPKIGYSVHPRGSLHNRPVSAACLQAIALLEGN